jgi:ankyrin repeat protein
LHHIILSGHNINKAKLYLQIAGNDAWKLINHQSDHNKFTPLHCAASRNYVELVKLFLNTAGERVRDFIDIQNSFGKTALDIATPEVKEVMLPYLNKES